MAECVWQGCHTLLLIAAHIKINMNTYLIIEFVSLIDAEAGDLRYDIYV